MPRLPRFAVLCTLALLSFTLSGFAMRGHDDNDRSSVGSDITIAEGETVSDVACAFCSVHVHGNVTGDVAVAFGSVTVDPGHQIAGDTAILEGDLNLGEGAAVNGDLAILAGTDRLSEGATVHGSRAVIPQPLGTLILLSPLIFLIAVIWLIVYLVRRNRYRFPVYPQGQGIYPPPPPRP
jgi:hypothetical protein